MLRIAGIFLLIAVVTAATDSCPNNKYKQHGEACACSDICLGNSHCQRNDKGGYSCQCLPFFAYDPELRQCAAECCHETAIDECADIINPPCEQGCIDTADGFTCTCGPGFVVSQSNRTKCEDINECKDGQSCQHNCNNTQGGFQCSCRPGYVVSQSDRTECEDIDECFDDKPCQQACTNTEGSYRCGCRDGYVVSPKDPNKCVDIDECKGKPCQHTCTNTDGGFECSCKPGFAVSAIDPTKCAEPTCIDHVMADIYFLGDASNSIASVGWGRELTFISNISSAFHLGPQDVQIAFGIFSTNFKHIFDLNAYTGQAALANAVLSTAQLKTNTYTYDALNAVKNNAYLTSVNFGGERNVSKILIVITDGQSQNITRTIAAADDLRRKNITILSVGVGVQNPLELQGIAGHPKNVYSVRSFAVLDSIRGEITQQICNSPKSPPVDPCVLLLKLDLVFVVDSSNKLGKVNHDRNVVFISSVIRAFTAGPNGAQFALVLSDTKPEIIFNLTSTMDVIYQALQAIPYKTNTTNTYTGFLEASTLFDAEHGGREGATKTIILLSDGKAHDPSRTIKDAAEVKNKGINVITIGILPEADLDGLDMIASKSKYIFSAKDYSSLIPVANKVSNVLCEAPSTPQPICVDELVADIYFLGDSSNSIHPNGWNRELTFIANISQAFNLGPRDVQVSFGIFSNNFKHIFDLNAYTNKHALTQAVLSTAQLKSTTYTYAALNAINKERYLTSAAHGGARKVPKILIVITDGQSQNVTKTIEAAKELRKQNITILSVGVGFTNPVEIQGIAGHSRNVFSVKNFGVLDTIREEITLRICEAPTPLEVRECPQTGLLDLVFVVDTLSPVNSTDFNRNFVFVSAIASAFNIGQSSTKIAVLISDQVPYVLFSLASNLDVIYQSLANDTKTGSRVHTYKGLLAASQHFTRENGARDGAIKTIVLLSDGKSKDSSSLIAEAKEVKNKGINIVTLGILPGADILELSLVASTPVNIFVAQNYDSIFDTAANVADAICRGNDSLVLKPQPAG